jgi:DNA-binding NtrC family response regulator
LNSRPKTTVLLIDDDLDFRRPLELAIRHAGYELRVADNGREALRILQENPVDVLVTDIIMPEMEGIELILKLRRLHPALPVIAMSAGGRADAESYLDLAHDCGARFLLNKPFRIEALLGALQECLPTKAFDPGL